MSEFHKEMASLLDYMTEHMDWETLIECYFENTGHRVKLPWYFVPKLVAQRLVGLKICSKNEVNLSYEFLRIIFTVEVLKPCTFLC